VKHLIYSYLGSSVGVGNRQRDVRHGSRRSIVDEDQKPLLSSKGPDRLRESQILIFKLPCVLSSRVKWQGREANHSYYTSDKVKNAWMYVSTPPTCNQEVILN
jgi:hypothetical protein